MFEGLDWEASSYFDGIDIECLVGGNHKIVLMAKVYGHWDCRYSKIAQLIGSDVLPTNPRDYTAVAKVIGDIDTYLIMFGDDIAYQKLDDDAHEVEIIGSPMFLSYVSRLDLSDRDCVFKAIQRLFIMMAKRGESVY